MSDNLVAIAREIVENRAAQRDQNNGTHVLTSKNGPIGLAEVNAILGAMEDLQKQINELRSRILS